MVKYIYGIADNRILSKVKQVSDFTVRTGKGNENLAKEFISPILRHLNKQDLDITVIHSGFTTYVFFANEDEVISKLIPSKPKETISDSAHRKILVRNLAKKMLECELWPMNATSVTLRYGRKEREKIIEYAKVMSTNTSPQSSLFHKIKNEVDNLVRRIRRCIEDYAWGYEEVCFYQDMLGKAFYEELASNNSDTENIFMEAYNLYVVQNVMQA